MEKTVRKRGTAAFWAAVGVVLCLLSSHAEDALGAFGGAGGVARETETRALSAPKPQKEAKIPQVAAPKSAKPKAGRRLDPTRKLGPVKGVRVYGSREFGQRVELDKRVLKLLESDEVRTVGDVQNALKSVQQELMNKGFYLVQLSLPIKDVYLPEDGTIGVLVDEGRFGQLTLHFYGDGVVTNSEGIADTTAEKPTATANINFFIRKPSRKHCR